jgi:thiamine-monophosphate kinase
MVTGSLGGAAAGRRIAEGSIDRPLDAVERDAVERFMRPTARIGEAAIVATIATAMIDLSDGLSLDLARLCDASGVGARIRSGMIPIHPCATLDEALDGGEDYELLATVPAGSDVANDIDRTFGVTLSRVGSIIQTAGIIAEDDDGLERVLTPRGWDPFA